MSYSVLQGNNGYIPGTDATGQLVVGFSRNVKAFKLARYSVIRPVTKGTGKYMRLQSQQGSRQLYPDGRDRLWADGADRPNGLNNLSAFEFTNYLTKRYDFPYMMGQKAVTQAEFQVQQIQDQQILQQAMTLRTTLALSALAGANWGVNTADVDGALLTSGQNWKNGTKTSPNLKNTILQVLARVKLTTQGALTAEDFALVMGVETAIGISSSPEVHEAFIQSQFALNQLQGDTNLNEEWGLPSKLAGVHIVVEDATVTRSAVDATSLVQEYALPPGTAYLVCRPRAGRSEGLLAGSGESEQDEVTPIIATLAGFFFEEMTVEAYVDPRNRRVEGHVVEDYTYQLTSPLGGFKLTKCLG